MKKKILATLLCLCMVVCMLPTVAFAEGESGIQLGTSGLGADDTVYFGTYGTTEVPWYVLNTNGFMLSKYTIGTSTFRNWEDWGYYNYSTVSNIEDSSNLKDAMDGLYGTLFSGLEQGAITETTLTGSSMYDSNTPDVDAYLFPLSFDEAENLGWGNDKLKAPSITAPEGSAGLWWLRSSFNIDYAFCVIEDGYYHIIDVVYALGVRPAFNLDLNSVLFTSAAEGGKSINGAVGADALNSNLTPTGNEYKLTLEDTNRDFTAATTAYDNTSEIVTVAYSGATVYNAATAPNEYISAIIKGSDNSVKYYGRIAQPAAADGTININLYGKYASGDTLYVFSEQYNGDKKTDYASALVEVSLTKNAYAITNSLTNITSDNTSTYRLTNDMTDYTAALSVGGSYALPTAITVEVGGIELANTAYTYSNGSLTVPAASITGDIEIIAVGVAPHSHSWATAWTTNSTHHWHECEGTGTCGITENSAKDSYGGHTAGDWIIDTNATASANGSKHKECTTCAYVMETATIPATGGGSDDPDPTYYYTLTFDVNGGSAISSVRRAEYTTINLSGYTPTREGFEFIGWYSDEALTNKITSVRLTANTTIYAGWEDKTNPNTGFENPFTDVSETDWFYDDVMFVFANDLMIGTSDTTFSPYGTTTRAMVATTIWRMEGEPTPTGANGFTDVLDNQYYTEAITWAAEKGITEGYGGGRFGTNDPVTREQLAGFFYNYAKYKGYDLTVTGSLDRFTDKGDISDWAVDAMKWAIGYGIIEGKDNNTLDPQGDATRAEFAAMLHRLCEKNDLEKGVTATGLMGWIDPKRLVPPATGDSAAATLWTSAMLFSLGACIALTVILKRRKENGGADTQMVRP